MMYILDSSAIAIILKRFREKAIGLLEGNVTLNLAHYELGNIIWKEHAVEKRISQEEAVDKAQKTAKILQLLKTEEAETPEDFKEAMKLAVELKLTFYDSAYIQKAKAKTLTLVTEDKELLKKAGNANVKAVTVKEFTSKGNNR